MQGRDLQHEGGALSLLGAAGLAGGESVFIPWQEPMRSVLLQHIRLRSRWWERREEHDDAIPRRVCAGHLQPGEGRRAVHPGRAAGGRCLPQCKCPERGFLLHTHQDPGRSLRGHKHCTHAFGDLTFKDGGTHPLFCLQTLLPFQGHLGA